MRAMRRKILFAGLVTAALVALVAQERAPSSSRTWQNPGRPLEIDGLIKPWEVVTLSAESGGILKEVLVDRGDRVEAGQVVATLQSDSERAAVEIARARVQQEAPLQSSQARLAFSEKKHLQNEALYQDGLLSLEEIDLTRTEKVLAESALLQVREAQKLAVLDLKRVEVELEKKTVRSTLPGVVVERFHHPGELLVSDDSKIVRVARLDPLRVEVLLSIAVAARVSKGMKAEIRPEVPASSVFPAHVTVIDPVVDAASGTVLVRLEMANKDLKVPAGLKCRVKFLESE